MGLLGDRDLDLEPERGRLGPARLVLDRLPPF